MKYLKQFHEKRRCDVFVVLYLPKNYSYDPPNYSPTSKADIDGLTVLEYGVMIIKILFCRTSFEHGGLSGDSKMWKVELVVKELTE